MKKDVEYIRVGILLVIIRLILILVSLLFKLLVYKMVNCKMYLVVFDLMYWEI